MVTTIRTHPTKAVHKEPFAIQPEHERILRAVYDFRFMTAEQLLRLFGQKHLPTMQIKLQQLTNEKYLNRFARSLKMLVDSLVLFQELGIDFISYKENIDTTTSMGRLIFHINSAYAEFEREIIKDRVIAGIKAKREKTGIWGRKTIDADIQTQIKALIQAGSSVRNTAKQLHISTRTVRKYK